ncbi:ADP,ATP carrier protein 1, mitochondrial-like, partial [Herrania umbratica]|uniref:ADP/ATP translocase n=1 Tax=Herrania umbratica TaxID=108875 RepID=A0A6J1B587_9ROSI
TWGTYISSSKYCSPFLQESNRAKRANCRMEHGPMHPPVPQKIHWQPDLSVRHLNYTPRMQEIHGGGALVNRISSCFVTPLTHTFVSALWEKDPFLFGLATRGIIRTAVAPFERVKLLMQNQNEMIKSGRLIKPYNGIFDCYARTIRNEGIFSLWRGNVPRATTHILAKVLQVKFDEYIASQESRWSTFQMKSAAVLSSVVNQFLVYPFLYAGTRMANDVKTTGSLSKWQFNGILDVYRKTLKVDGIPGLFRGYTMALAQLGVVTVLSPPLTPWRHFLYFQARNSYLGRGIVNCAFDLTGKLVCHPLDTVSRRMMMTSGEAVKYKSSRNAFAQIFKTEGVKSFYKGAGSVILASAVYSVSKVLLYHPYDIYAAAVENEYYGSVPGFSISFKWKNEGGISISFSWEWDEDN